MSARIFVSRQAVIQESSNVLFLLREAMPLLFPGAVLVEGPEIPLKTPHSFFLRQGETLLWAEVFFHPFMRTEICDYLARMKQIQGAFPSGVCGILTAPSFEEGVREMLEFSRLPARIFRYHEIISLESGETAPSPNLFHESSLWIEEISWAHPKKNFHVIEPPQDERGKEEEQEEPAVDTGLVPHWNRLSREELREFVQLELDWVSQDRI